MCSYHALYLVLDEFTFFILQFIVHVFVWGQSRFCMILLCLLSLLCSTYWLIKMSLFIWQLYCNHHVHGDFLITLYNIVLYLSVKVNSLIRWCSFINQLWCSVFQWGVHRVLSQTSFLLLHQFDVLSVIWNNLLFFFF